MKQALILQGWPQPIDKHWYPWLKMELERKGYRVFLPDLPTMHSDSPQMSQPNKINHAQVIAHTQKRIVLHSDNDPFVTAVVAGEMSKRLEAEMALAKGAGHFMDSDGYNELPQLLSMID